MWTHTRTQTLMSFALIFHANEFNMSCKQLFKMSKIKISIKSSIQFKLMHKINPANLEAFKNNCWQFQELKITWIST